ncbi:three-helix bundle dimerization domain-containing protein [Nocardia sp. NPDC048505]|uniref:three-helix bundle dimerization domain-containing protein n=1 Tax=unclassified Nocardia TaxID=2637762 RepID=UPI0033C883A5
MTESPASATHTDDPTLDQGMALRVATHRLTEEFGADVEETVIGGLLRAAYDHLAADAKLDNFLPLLAERYTRELLRAAAEQRVGSRAS